LLLVVGSHDQCIIFMCPGLLILYLHYSSSGFWCVMLEKTSLLNFGSKMHPV
jgi:hypothetical protein